MRRLLMLSGILVLFMLGIYLGWRGGIRHAMEDCRMSVYIDGRVIVELDGHLYEHKAF